MALKVEFNFLENAEFHMNLRKIHFTEKDRKKNNSIINKVDDVIQVDSFFFFLIRKRQ